MAALRSQVWMVQHRKRAAQKRRAMMIRYRVLVQTRYIGGTPAMRGMVTWIDWLLWVWLVEGSRRVVNGMNASRESNLE